ncbi:MAG TPA: ATP-binding cassette domain-containing protein [Glycomyces sp.]|nr:ATP-binding cassette domain-containing protein [Glycomyces sp.]
MSAAPTERTAAEDPTVRVAGLRADAGGKTLVENVEFTVSAGRVLAIVGASGSGKTTIGSALLGAVKPGVHAAGTVEVAGVDVLNCTPGEVPAAYLPQHPAAVLNPVRRIGGVLTDIANAKHRNGKRTAIELASGDDAGSHHSSPPPDSKNRAPHGTPQPEAGAARRHDSSPPFAGRALARAAIGDRIAAAMRRAGLEDRALLRRFPHQLSGGQQQRLVLAQAFLCDAKLLVADEPTTAQDAGHRDRLAAELRLAAANGMAVVLLSHDLDLVKAVSDDTMVLETGTAVEYGPTAQVFTTPHHAYTKALLAARTAGHAPAADTDAPVRLAGTGLTVVKGRSRILDGVDFIARQGECLAVLGVSGSGKTTLARTVAGLQQASAGELRLDGEVLPVRGRRRDRAERARVQYVFQDARASFDEYRSILDQVARSAVRLRGLSTAAAREEAQRILSEVGLPAATAKRRRDKLSGGQLQRAALARALAAEPEVLVCDEITSGLDALTRRGVLDLLGGLKEQGLTILLITHEQAVADHLADRVLRIKDGKTVAPDLAEV